MLHILDLTIGRTLRLSISGLVLTPHPLPLFDSKGCTRHGHTWEKRKKGLTSYERVVLSGIEEGKTV